MPKAQITIDEAEAKQAKATAELSKARKCGDLYTEQAKRLTQEKERLEAKLAAKAAKNCKLFLGCKMTHAKLHPEKFAEYESNDKKEFLVQARCVENDNSVDPLVLHNYLLDTLPRQVPLCGPEVVQFVNTNNTRLIAMQMRMLAAGWETTNLEELQARFERQRTTLGESSTSQAESQTKI